MVVPSDTQREIYTLGERRVRVQPNILPVRCVTRDRFIAEAYGRHREFAVACTMVLNIRKKACSHDS